MVCIRRGGGHPPGLTSLNKHILQRTVPNHNSQNLLTNQFCCCCCCFATAVPPGITRHSFLADHVDEEEVLWNAFQFFDRDGNGDISVAELRSTMNELGGLLTEEELQTFISIMDVNNDGVIGVGVLLSRNAA